MEHGLGSHQNRTADRAAEAVLLDAPGSETSAWRDLMETADQRIFARAWLSIVSRALPTIRQAALFLNNAAGPDLPPIARWASDSAALDAERLAHYGKDVLDMALRDSQPAVETVHEPEPCSFAAFPLTLDGTLHGAVLVEAALADPVSAKRLLRHLQWGSGWIEAFSRRTHAGDASLFRDRAAAMLEAGAAAGGEQGFTEAARVVAALLARQIGAEQVAIGRLRGLRHRLIAISQTATFDRRANLSKAFTAAMDEAVDQRTALMAPSADGQGSYVVASQERLRRQLQASSVLTMPMALKDLAKGAVTFVRTRPVPFEQAEVDLAQAIIAAVTPILEDKFETDRSLVTLAGMRVSRFATQLFGPRHLAYKAIGLVATCVLAIAWFGKADHTIRAHAQVEGAVRRVLSAPFDGYIRTQFVRAGDTVRAGQVLAELQDNDLVLDRLRRSAERHQALLEYDRALSKGDLAQTGISRAQVEQKDAEIQLSEMMIDRTQIVAPFDAVVVSGDLSQAIGRPVSRGDTLFELAPLDSYRVTLVVPEDEIGRAAPGQSGELLLTAIPDQPFDITLQNITPVARTADGLNGFEVTSTLDSHDVHIRPAMEGVAKIAAGRERLLWLALQPVINWVRIKTWPWIP